MLFFGKVLHSCGETSNVRWRSFRDFQSFLLKGEKYADVRKCADCGKTFINETFLKAHQERRHPKREEASQDVKHKITKEESILMVRKEKKIGFCGDLWSTFFCFRSEKAKMGKKKMLRWCPPKSRPWPTNCWANSSNEICKKVLQAGRCHQNRTKRELKSGS